MKDDDNLIAVNQIISNFLKELSYKYETEDILMSLTYIIASTVLNVVGNDPKAASIVLRNEFSEEMIGIISQNPTYDS